MPAAMCPASAAGETAAALQQAPDICPARQGIGVKINILLRCCRMPAHAEAIISAVSF